MHSMRFVLFLGLVSLFADMTYEGARSISGQFLGLLGANALIVSTVAGFGEFIGYAGRFFFGFLTDKTKKYWPITIIGYLCNVFSVPLMAFSTHWSFAAFLLIAERFGKAIRTPARDAMLSYATKEIGRGWGFGIHQAMDRVGSFCGPIIVSAILYFTSSYPFSFASLAIPALFSIITLLIARQHYPNPQDLEKTTPQNALNHSKHLSKQFWLYVIFSSFIAVGYVDFPLIAYHFSKTGSIEEAYIPIFYAFSMIIAAITALICGRLYDRIGLPVIVGSIILFALFPLFVFQDNLSLIAIGIMLWGLGMGFQGSVLRAGIASLAPIERRATAYGIFNACFGLFWALGSIIIGFLYEISILYLIIFSIVIQLASIPLVFLTKRPNYS